MVSQWNYPGLRKGRRQKDKVAKKVSNDEAYQLKCAHTPAVAVSHQRYHSAMQSMVSKTVCLSV